MINRRELGGRFGIYFHSSAPASPLIALIRREEDGNNYQPWHVYTGTTTAWSWRYTRSWFATEDSAVNTTGAAASYKTRAFTLRPSVNWQWKSESAFEKSKIVCFFYSNGRDWLYTAYSFLNIDFLSPHRQLRLGTEITYLFPSVHTHKWRHANS